MACVGTGKISEQCGLRQALELVKAKPLGEGVLRILSKEASGRIGVRGGRFLIGAHITSSGLSGYPALKVFLGLKRGMFYYLEPAPGEGLPDLEQSLGVDVDGLLWQCQSADDLLQRFSHTSQEHGWDCITAVVVNPHPLQSGSPAFGDSFLDRIAWTATNTMQRLQSLGARQKQQAAAPSHNQAAVGEALVPERQANCEAASLRAAVLVADASPIPSLNALGQEASQGADQVVAADNRLSRASEYGISDQLARQGAPVDVAAAAQTPPPGPNTLPSTNPAPLLSACVFPALSPLQVAPQGLTDQGQPAPASDAPVWLPPSPAPGGASLQSVPPPAQAGQSEAWYKPQGGAQDMQLAPPSPQVHTFFDRLAQSARSTMQGLKVLRVNQTKDEQPAASAKAESVLEKLGDTARSTMQGLKALGKMPRTEDIWNVADQQRQRSLAKPVRDEKQRMRAYAERTAESQKLRIMDIEEALQEHDKTQPTVKRLVKKFDLASAGGLFLIGGAVVLFVLSFLTLSALNSGDESVKLAKQYAAQGKNEQAVEQLTLALQHKQADIGLLMWRADLYDKIGDTEHESLDYDLVVSAHPESKQAWLKNAMLANRLSQYDRALKITKGMLDRFASDVDAKAARAIALSGAGQYEQSLDAIAKIRNESELAGDMVAPLNRARGWDYFNLKKPDQAMPSYKRAIELSPDDPLLHHEIAQVFEQLQDYDSAIDHLHQAIKLAPANGWNYEELAKADDLKQDYEKAIVAYNDAVKLIPRPADDFARMAADELTLQHYAEALTDCDLAERLVPGLAQAEKIKALALAKQEAETPIQTATVEQEPKQPLSDPNSPVSKGYRALKQGKNMQAVRLLTAAAKADPDDPEVRVLLALSYARSGHAGEAYEQFSWLDSNQRLPIEYKFIFADCALSSNHPERALTIYGDCLEEKPQWIEARCRMIRACLATGLTERANAVAQEGIIRAKDESEKQMYQAALKSVDQRK